MAEHLVTFDISPTPVQVPTGTLLSEAARLAGVDVMQPCGGQGRCGRCTVLVTSGAVRRRSTLRLSQEDIAEGYALACQSVIEGDVSISIPPQEKIERRLTTDRTVAEVEVPAGYDPGRVQTIRRVNLMLTPPSLDDQIDDWSRLQIAFRQQVGVSELTCSLSLLRKLGSILREEDWRISAILDAPSWEDAEMRARLIDLKPGHALLYEPLWGAAIDIGTTTVTLWLVDLVSGKVHAQVAEYNGQISRGEDVISRIIYASKNGGGEQMRNLVLDTINALLETACKRIQITSREVVKATIAGNSTMIHLLLGIPATSIRLAPFITAVNHMPGLTAREVGIDINPEANVDCLPGVASYVGADISAGV